MACLFSSQALSFLLGTATRFFFDATTSLFFRFASRFGFGPHLCFDLYAQASFLFSAATRFLFHFATSFFLDAATRRFIGEAAVFRRSVHQLLSPRAYARRFVRHRPASSL